MGFRGVLLAVTFLLCLTAGAAPDYWFALCIDVIDGDTIIVDREAETIHVRLHGVDCPEAGQDYGDVAAAATARAVLNRYCWIVPTDTDRYGRTVAWVFPAGVTSPSLNEALVASGHAWWYAQYAPRSAVLARAQVSAVQSGRGIWGTGHAVPPWSYRNGYACYSEGCPTDPYALPELTAANTSTYRISAPRSAPRPRPSRAVTFRRQVAQGFASRAPGLPTLRYNGPVRVGGYYRKDGTYVRPHTRSRPRR